MLTRTWYPILLCAAAGIVSGQTTVRSYRYEAPASVEPALEAARKALPSARQALPRAREFWFESLNQAERAGLGERNGREIIGVHRKLSVDSRQSTGDWAELPDGTRVWRAVFRSPGAHALRVHFRRFATGTGRVWVHDENAAEQHVYGPYSGRGIYDDGDFWSDVVLGDRIVVEYQPSAEAAGAESLPFNIEAVSHIAGQLLASDQRQNAAPCHVDITCQAEWAEQARAVARYLFETDEGTGLCSGTVLATRNRSGIPYFITADHCLNTDAVARTVQAFWFYQTQSCNGPAPNVNQAQRTLGARYLAGGALAAGDFTLLRLNSVPNGVTFVGWTTDEPAQGAQLVGIHHPRGDYKRFSIGNRISDAAPLAGTRPENYYRILWQAGRTEPGSSGSGLFNDQGLLVGTLTSGLRAPTGGTVCDVTPYSSSYGRFRSAFGEIREFLEDRPSVPPPGGDSPNEGTVLGPGVPATFAFDPVTGPTLFTGAAGFRVVVPEGATRLTVRVTGQPASANIDLFGRFGRPVEVAEGRAVADYVSSLPAAEETMVINLQSNPPLRAGTYFFSLAVFTPNVATRGTIVATIDTADSGNPGGGAGGDPSPLNSGQAARFSFDAVTSPTLFGGGAAYRITVPQGATRLEIRLNTTTPGVDMDLYARFGSEPDVSGGRVNADFRSESESGEETIVITPTSTPALRAGTYFISLAVFTTGRAAEGTLTATVSTGSTPPPSGSTPVVLTSGQARTFSFDAVQNGTLFTGAAGFQINVPQNASRLVVRINGTPATADVDLFVRFAQEPAIANGRVVSDHTSEGPAFDESITVTSGSTPPLRAGTYFIAMALFTTGTRVNGTITATVETGGGTAGPTALTPGQPRAFSLPAVTGGTLFGGANSFQVTVPQGATRLQVRVNTQTPNADVDLFVRFNQAPAVQGGNVAADHSSVSDTGNEVVTVDANSNPPLRAGTYFISLALFTPGVAVSGTVVAIVDTAPAGPPAGVTTLTAGLPVRYNLPSVEAPTLFNGNFSYRVTVPEGASRLDVRLSTPDPAVDVDLYVRYGAEPEVVDGAVVADHESFGDTGNEVISINRSSQPPLRPGVYFISLVLYTTGRPATGTLTVNVERQATAPPPASGAVLPPGIRQSFTLPAVNSPTLFAGAGGFRFAVPQNATRVVARLVTETPGVDVDLYVRFNSPPVVADGRVVAEYRSIGDTGNEELIFTPLSSPALREGVYFIGFVVFGDGRPVNATIEVNIDGPNAGDGPELRPEQQSGRTSELTKERLQKGSGSAKQSSPLLIDKPRQEMQLQRPRKAAVRTFE